ncbi:RadP cytochrome P450 epoxidase [Zopfia rhizophila CBS 207.26]|uniref:RadP cytochrome P450 epoxidase n=1 Tax=Zopfia rhizophila CBS 207.26 TaxID=1314779 RepID=A0A6A6DMM4_9PEZI|nr:RadP cytochrome P450 epoxidase [Zopfia rhizophila CBS 207.26]
MSFSGRETGLLSGAAEHPLASFFAIGVFAFLGYRIGIAIYNVYFHPLAKFPGPKIYAASQIPITIKRITGDEVQTFYRLHLQYGPYVRVAPGELSTINPAAAKDIYGRQKNGRLSIPKDFKAYYMKNQRKDDTEGLMTADDETHTRQRKVFSPAFSERALRAQEPLLKKYTDLFIARLGDEHEKTGKVDMVSWLNFATFDFIADCVFGDSLHLLEKGEYNALLANIPAVVKFSAMRRAIRSFPFMDTIFQAFIPKSMIQKRMEHVKFCDERVDRRLEKQVTDNPDFWTLVLEAGNKGDAMTRGEQRQNSFLLLTAATETTSSLLSALTYLLCQNPDKLQKLKDEVRSTFQSTEQMTTITLPPLKYLQACIEEGLRVYPPVPGGLPRRTPPEGANLDGNELPPDVVVYFAHFAAYHSPSHFNRPDDFIPERWLPTPPAEFAHDRKDAVMAFSAGHRDCIGKSLAYHEARLLLAKLVWSFDLELCAESQDWIKQKSFIVGAKEPLYVKLRRVVREK